MSTRPGECGYCNMDHASTEPCPELDPTAAMYNRRDVQEAMAKADKLHQDAESGEEHFTVWYVRKTNKLFVLAQGDGMDRDKAIAIYDTEEGRYLD